MIEICDKINNRGISIIAAFDNDGSISFPAAFDNVIGVTTDNNCRKNNQYFVTNNNIVNVGAKGIAQKIIWNNNKYSIGKGNSYACAHVTGIGIKLIKNIANVDSKHLLKLLKSNQHQNVILNIPEYNLPHRSNLNYKQAAVFPFNKEMHALIRFEDMLPFEIVDVYDIKYSPNIGGSTNQLLDISSENNHIIKKIDDLEWENIDALIIGHTQTISNVLTNNSNIIV